MLGIPQSELTPKVQEAISQLMAKLDLAQHFDAIVTSSTEPVEKPHPELFRRALTEVGLRPSTTLHAGDHLLNDVSGARAAGMEAIWIDREGTLVPPDDVFRITSIEDLVAIVRSLCP